MKMTENGIIQARNKELKAKQVFSLFALCVLVAAPDLALAAAQPWDNTINAVIGIFTGGLARAIAILVCIGLGVAAWLGKLSWKAVGGLVGGFVLVFGAAAIADFFIASV